MSIPRYYTVSIIKTGELCTATRKKTPQKWSRTINYIPENKWCWIFMCNTLMSCSFPWEVELLDLEPDRFQADTLLCLLLCRCLSLVVCVVNRLQADSLWMFEGLDDFGCVRVCSTFQVMNDSSLHISAPSLCSCHLSYLCQCAV